ncbi:MAG: hypothetical protein JL56_13115 [Desulfotomaculum sp. BICA1-6]|nr:MAG: hypothetical protein JL56_13115 [Desulfotomaculum sp. BICA1-6]
MYDIELLNRITRIRTLHYRRDLDEIYLLAKSTPSLTRHLPELQEVINWFDGIFSTDIKHEELTGFWFDFANMVLQRYAVLFTTELSAADNLVRNFFHRFFMAPGLSQIKTSYRENVTPLVFLGRGGRKAYYTLPPTIHRPLAIIRLPRAALNNVWRWTVLAHETGHDVFSSVGGLAREMDVLVASTVNQAAASGYLCLPPVNAVIEGNGAPVVLEMSPGQFAVSLWSRWVNELFADLFSILMCGPACVLTMQELLGFNSVGNWHGLQGPDAHPVPIFRNMINLRVLHRIGFISDAGLLERRMGCYVYSPSEIIWLHEEKVEVVRVNLVEMLKMADIVVDAMLHTPLQSLNNHSLRQIINFDAQDQVIVSQMAMAVIGEAPVAVNAEARHLAAAAQIAFVEQPYQADDIHNNVLKLMSD